jgi:nicotinamide phosphoribosyltransferase
MKAIQPLIQADFYKMGHYRMYPKGMQMLYSNFTPRKSRIPGINHVVVFGIQYWVKEYLINQWNDNFFNKPKEEVIQKYLRMMNCTLGPKSIDSTHIEQLHDLGYLPLEIKALAEGTKCPIKVPCMTLQNTKKGFEWFCSWLVNYLETIASCTIWQPMTSATIAHQYKLIFDHFALETVGDTGFTQWQGHDFSMRGMSSLETACTSGAGHLLSFTGTDTIPAIEFLEHYYGANVEKELVGASVPATEHSVMCMGTKSDEIGTFERLLREYFDAPVLSVVSDTWDLWEVVKPGGYCDRLKDLILSRPGKLVIRPDSGDPVDILCGLDGKEGHTVFERDGELRIRNNDTGISKAITEAERKGVIELLWDVFGGTMTAKGYKLLDQHIGSQPTPKEEPRPVQIQTPTRSIPVAEQPQAFAGQNQNDTQIQSDESTPQDWLKPKIFRGGGLA